MKKCHWKDQGSQRYCFSKALQLHFPMRIDACSITVLLNPCKLAYPFPYDYSIELKCIIKDPSLVSNLCLKYKDKFESLWSLWCVYPCKFTPLACLRLASSILHRECMLINRLAQNPGLIFWCGLTLGCSFYNCILLLLPLPGLFWSEAKSMLLKNILPFSALVFWPAKVVSPMKKEGLSWVLRKRN